LLASSAAYYATGVYAQARVPADLPLPATETIQEGDPIAKLRIPKIGLDAAVFEGVSERSLVKGPGHMPGTAVPGRPSGYNNCVITGHRDSFFRKLGWIRAGDVVRVETGGVEHAYRFVRRRIVRPQQITVAGPTREPQLTLITCYPFDFIGAAPYRLVWEARPVPQTSADEAARSADRGITRVSGAGSAATPR
jgi:sortase A